MTFVTNGVSLGRQALRRDVNTRISVLGDRCDAETVEVFCECGRSRCADRIRIEMGAYEKIVGSAAYFVVTAGHEQSGAEELVERQNGYAVVERRPRR